MDCFEARHRRNSHRPPVTHELSDMSIHGLPVSRSDRAAPPEQRNDFRLQATKASAVWTLATGRSGNFSGSSSGGISACGTSRRSSGLAWAVLQPLLTMLVFTVIFGRFAQIPSDGLPYSIFAFTALVPWTYFSQAISRSGVSLVSDADLVRKVYFPRV